MEFMSGDQKQRFQETLQSMIEAKGLVTLQELRSKIENLYPGYPKGTITGYQDMKRPDNVKNPVLGEKATEYSEIRKTNWKSLEGGGRETGFCLTSFDDDISTNQEYYARMYLFSEDELNEQVRKKPEKFEDTQKGGTEMQADESTEDMESQPEGDPEVNEREIRYAEVLNRRKNIVLEGPPGTGKTYAIEGIVKELRSCGIDVGGDGEGESAITMHPATSYEDFIEGLRPIGKGNFGYKSGVFVQRVKHAIQNPLQQHVLLLDELNRSNVPRVLGDLLTTLEPSKRTESVFNLARKREYFTDFNFVSATITIPIDGAPTGLRFSVPLMRQANSNQGDVSYICNPLDEEIRIGLKKEDSRDFKKSDFDGNHGALHNVLDKTNLHEIVFISINGIAHPIVSPEVVASILQNQPLEPVSEIQILTLDGVQTYLIKHIQMNEQSEYNSGKVSGTISLNIAVESDIDCECYDDDGKENEDMVSDYYWCEACDDSWDDRDRTEVSLSGSKKLLHVPNNLLVVATMNTTDRSVAPLDAALRRRFVFLRVDPLDKLPRKDKKGLSGEKLKIFNETEKLWIVLNKKLKTTLGHDATIGHSYLFDLIKELERAESDERCDELRKQFWQYSVLPQVADLLDATGRSNVVWEKMGLKKAFKAIELSLNTGPEDFKSFARTIVEENKDEEEPSEAV